MMNMNIIEKYLNELDFSYDEKQIDNFNKYYELLVEWNKKFNLTSITEYEDVVLKHFIDSILICKFIEFKGKRIIDVGTGAGFPGIPLKIMNPDSEIILLDSLNKRINFLNTVIKELKLSNIKALHGRAEDVSREKKYRGSFDYSVSRAVANLSTLSEYCIPFLKTGGCFVSYKSDKSEDEINSANKAIKTLKSKIIKVEETGLPGTDIIRRFVIIENIEPVDMRYPRKAGIPSKDPL